MEGERFLQSFPKRISESGEDRKLGEERRTIQEAIYEANYEKVNEHVSHLDLFLSIFISV